MKRQLRLLLLDRQPAYLPHFARLQGVGSECLRLVDKERNIGRLYPFVD